MFFDWIFVMYFELAFKNWSEIIILITFFIFSEINDNV